MVKDIKSLPQNNDCGRLFYAMAHVGVFRLLNSSKWTFDKADANWCLDISKRLLALDGCNPREHFALDGFEHSTATC